jgi:4-amino-4-deoxy-L-arabinose transferase-like glycosyltransferase
VWLGPAAVLVSLLGTWLLGNADVRPWAIVALLAAGVLAILAWSDARWFTAFPMERGLRAGQDRGARNWLALGALAGAVLILVMSHVAFLRAPDKTFGLAGWLWLADVAVVVAAAVIWNIADAPVNRFGRPPAWTRWEAAGLAGIAVLALALRICNLKNVPFNIYPDEIMTGVTAERAYISGSGHAPSVFGTLWGDIELPALWFAIVASAMKLGGVGLGVARLPAALFGAATVVPFYGLVRSVWGRAAAITGASIMAFSAADVHYSRMALNNITTPFFWTLCFFFLLRGLRSRRPTDWALAGLTGGLSEHFYYGTRLLPFILIGFVIYLLVVHRGELRRYIAQFGWLALGYLAGFGPLLIYFVMHPGLYYGRGAGLLTWNRIPANWQDLHQMWNTLWPIMSENLLGISTHTAQDIMYYGPLLLVPEAALLVLGVALLVWRWRHPAAFLVMLSGLGVLFVGGTLVLYPDSSPPMPAHWTPAFPAFYAAIAVPAGAWIASAKAWPWERSRWLAPAILGAGLFVLGYANIDFYFNRYYADPESLRIERYKNAQTMYEVQTIQSRYMASFGSNYRVVAVGKSPYPYDADMTRYLVPGQEYVTLFNPREEWSLTPAAGKGLVFLFFPGSEEYRETVRERYRDGTDGEVSNPAGRHLFYTLVVPTNNVR